MCNIIKESTVESQMKTMNNAINYITNAFEMQIIFIKLKEYKDVLLTESVNRLFLYKEYKYAIEIIAKSLYNLLYNLLNIKLITSKQYLNNVLTKE